MMPSNSLKILVAIGVLVLPVVAAAHHSANEFDQSKVVEIDGLIVDVFWRNPHVIIKVAADMGDPNTVWELERFPLTDAAMALLEKPWEWGAHWVWVPGEEVGLYECTVAE